MKSSVLHILSAAVLLLLSGQALHAQRYPERRDIRSGNRQYEQGDYPQSEVDYKRALEKDAGSYEAMFNLGNALYRQERYEESAQIFQQLAQDTTHADRIAHCHYNAGNALFKQRKLQEALEAYKSSLRKNPGDMDSKFNLAYVKKMLENEQGGGGGGGDNDQNQDQDKDDQQNQQGDQDKGDQKDDKGDQGKDPQDKDGQDGKDKGKNDGKPEQQQSQGQGMTQAEAQQMLEAMQAQEDKMQEKVDEKKKVAVPVGSRRNW